MHSPPTGYIILPGAMRDQKVLDSLSGAPLESGICTDLLALGSPQNACPDRAPPLWVGLRLPSLENLGVSLLGTPASGSCSFQPHYSPSSPPLRIFGSGCRTFSSLRFGLLGAKGTSSTRRSGKWRKDACGLRKGSETFPPRPLDITMLFNSRLMSLALSPISGHVSKGPLLSL